MIVIDPRFISVIQWTAQTAGLLAPFGTVPKLADPDRWREWATFVVELPQLAAHGPPRPEAYSTWEHWATAFNEVARLLV